jgi:hypothetical protein
VLLVRLCNLVSVLTSGESPDIDAVDYLRLLRLITLHCVYF